MKKKSRDKRSSYKNLDSVEMQEIRTSSKSWEKRSFIKLLVTIFVKTKGFIDSLYFYIHFLPDSSQNLQRGNKFVRNVSVFFVLFLLILIYRSGNERVSKQRDFILTKIKGQTRSESNYIDKNIEHDLKVGGTFKYKLQSFLKIVEVYKDSPFNLLIFQKKSLVYKYKLPKLEEYRWIGRSNSDNYFLDSHSYLKKVSNPDSFLLQILSKELEDICFRSSFSMKNKIDPSFQSSRKCDYHRFFANYYCYLWISSVQQDQIFAKAKGEYIFDPLVNSDFEIILDNNLLNMIQRNLKFLSRKIKTSKDWTVNRFFIEELFGSKYCLINTLIDRKIQIGEKDRTSLINLSKYYKYHFEWLARVIYIEDNKILDPLPIYKLLPTNLFFFKTMNSCEQIAKNKNQIKNSIHSQGIIDFKKYISNTFSQQFLVSYFGINSITDRNYRRILKEIKIFQYPNKFLRLRDIGINSFTKIQKYYFRLLFHFFLPFNSVYSIRQQNDFENKKIFQQIFLEIFNRLFSIYRILNESNIFVNQMGLIRDLKNKKSNISMSLAKKSEFLHFLRTRFSQLHRYNSSFKKSERYTGQSVLNILSLDFKRPTDYPQTQPFFVRSNNLPDPFVLFSKIHLNLVKNFELVLISNLGVNWNRRLSLYLDTFSCWDLKIIYPLFYTNLLQFYEFSLIVFEEKSFLTERINSILPTVHAQLFADSRMLNKTKIKSKVFDQYHFEYSFANIPIPKLKGKLVVNFRANVFPVLSMKGINIKMCRVMSNILPHLGSGSLRSKNSKYEVQNKVPVGENKSSEYTQIGSNYSFMKLRLFARYPSWFFTPDWWRYNTDLFLGTSQQTFLVIGYYFKYLGSLRLQIITKQFENSWGIYKNLHNFLSGLKSDLLMGHREVIAPTFNQCLNYRFLNKWRGLLAILTFVSFISFFKPKLFSILIGSSTLCLWKHFETIEYLTEISQVFESIESVILTSKGSKKTDNLVLHVFENVKRCIRDVQFYLLINNGLENWLIHNKSLDLSRREKSPLVQSLITCTRIERYGFDSYPKRNRLSYVLGYRVTSQQGFSYIRYLSGILKKTFVNHPLVLTNKWIHLASFQRIVFSRTLLNFDTGVPQIPIPLQFGLSHAKGILLIGLIESGRSYLVKNLAANSSVPLLGINMDKFLYNKPDILTESWISILIKSLRGLNLILDLANEMSPCIIWLRNIHQLDLNRPTRNFESEPAFLLGILSKYFQTNPTKIRTTKNIIIIGSTHLPGKVDPALISADRLDRIINIRSSNNSWRKNHFFLLLNKKNLRLRSDLLYLKELASKTTGYTTRDLAALNNEVSLINIARNELFVCKNTIELAFHRQVLRFTHMSNKSYFVQNFGILFYKIGRAVIQNLLIESFTMNPLSISNYSWKKNFYNLSEWYLEPSVYKSIVKEFTVIIHALGCLAGIAARDSWFLLEKESENSMALDLSVENDLSLASSILESLPIEFSRLEIRQAQFATYKQQRNKVSMAMNSSEIIQNGLFALMGENTIRNDSKDKSSISQHIFLNGRAWELQSTAWSPRPWRLSFSRSHLFDWIKRPNDSESLTRFKFPKIERNIISNDLQSDNNQNQLMGKGRQQLIYERILPRVRKRNVQELEFQLELILLEEKFEILGFCKTPTQYQMKYRSNNKPRFFIGKRILWDPTGSSTEIRNPIFSRREFFVDEEMLRRLYVTYGVRRERERSLFNHKIKRFFLRRGYNKELINKLSIRWWDQLPTYEEQSIDTWKRIEAIGVRLRRPQVFTPVYLYQRWLIENLPEKFPRFELLTQRERWFGIENLSLANSFAYTTLLESYQYLLEFLSPKKVLLDRAMKTLLIKKWLFQNEIRYLIHKFDRKIKE